MYLLNLVTEFLSPFFKPACGISLGRLDTKIQLLMILRIFIYFYAYIYIYIYIYTHIHTRVNVDVNRSYNWKNEVGF